MEYSCLNCRWVFSIKIVLVILLLCISFAPTETFANESDRRALLDFKSLITQDPLGIMSSWNDSVYFCDWVGVSCSSSKEKRVVTISLESRRLTGSIPPSIGNLTYLTGLNLGNNNFLGELPPDMGRLRRLQHINLTFNYLSGKIPSNLTQCSELTMLALAVNNFIGEIPDQLSSLSKLVILDFGGNNLTGKIPSWIGNFSSLFALSLPLNNFQGSIPSDFGRLSGLSYFQLYGNYLSGTIPPSIYNISTIYYFSVTQNLLHGQLPPDVGLTLPNLKIFAGGVNNFSGPIPVSLSNASGLQVLDFAQNGLIGAIPRNLGTLQSLVRLNFDQNNLANGELSDLSFLSSLANCTSLEVLGLGQNHFGGELPSSIGNLSTQLQILTIGQNLMHGRIPSQIENLVNLSSLGMEGNYLSGSVPDVIGKLQKLEGLYLNGNRFSGPIPFALGNLTRLTRLYMEDNRFEGSIPPSLGNCKNLQNLNLSSNNLNGTMPKQVIGLPSLSISLVMSNNSLSGSLPSEVGNLKQLAELDLSDNNLSGQIPSTLGSCISLERMNLEGNKFEGTIPESLKTLRGIEDLDLSRNNLSGKIPEFLSKLLFLKHLNLSNNDFEGEVSREGIFANTSSISITGNDKLCGGISELQLPTCSRKRHREPEVLKIVIPATIVVTFVIVMLFSFGVFCLVRNKMRQASTLTSEEWQVGMSYSEMVQSTNGFAAENLIGSGSFGSVYKGIVSGDKRIVAIKVLNLQQQGASKSFVDECNALRSIRHRNLLRIITACSTTDHQGNDFKALVFEFMSNGSLDHWLHRTADEQFRAKRLSLMQRLNIAIDVASALDYLHNQCETPIVHCDLKPSNVLLDEDMTAHVSDFGLTRFLFEPSKNPPKNQPMSAALKGSIGYIPPEYGLSGQVSVFGDIYSYGILLLEMFTGKRPIDEIFKDDLSIHMFIEAALPEKIMDIIDQAMLIDEGENNNDDDNDSDKNKDDIEEIAIIRDENLQTNKRSKIEECLVSVMRVGLSCSARSPVNRMAMNLAVNKLHRIRDSILGSRNRNRRRGMRKN